MWAWADTYGLPLETRSNFALKFGPKVFPGLAGNESFKSLLLIYVCYTQEFNSDADVQANFAVGLAGMKLMRLVHL